MSGYQFDVFISYRRSGNPHMWVRNHFLRRLTDCLADYLPREPKVFIDEEIDVGDIWPDRLRDALLRTRILVPIYTAQYFQSKWCLAELHSMIEREKLLGRPAKLIYPIRLADSESYPDSDHRQWRDLHPWYVPDPGYQQTVEYSEFHRTVEGVAIDLAARLAQVPEWQPDWPVRQPNPAELTPTRIPRF